MSIDRGLRFGTAADLYDRARPSYPPALVADVVAALPGRRVLEIGAGTGKATVLLAGYDVELVCLEPDASMAAVLRTRTEGARRQPEVVVSTFEGWQGTGDGSLDGIVAAQSWHWTAEDRWDRAASLLHSRGLLALWWNVELLGTGSLVDDLVAVYRSHGIDRQDSPLWSVEDSTWPAGEFAAHGGFEYLGVRSYPASQRYTAVDFTDYLDTTSHHRVLDDELRTSLSADLRGVIAARGGELTVNRYAHLHTGRRR